MAFSELMAVQRFGYGVSPVLDAPRSVDEMMAWLRGPDEAVQAYPLPPEAEVFAMTQAFAAARDAYRAGGKDSDGDGEAFEVFKALRKDQREMFQRWAGVRIARRVGAKDGFRERLVDFWADHFSAPGKNFIRRAFDRHYADVAIRPHVAGKFEDLLISAVLHPQMLHYLDQTVSIGPNSVTAQQMAGRNRGLNENLAREILELHTLGVDGAYVQADVRGLALLLTGMRSRQGRSFFGVNRAEPGADVVLGKRYGGDGPAVIADIHAALRDLARHPDTAAHLARKMARHFVSDAPSPELQEALRVAYVESGGDLSVVAEAMLRHPEAWRAEQRNFKQPLVFLCSAMRGLGVAPDRIATLGGGGLRRWVLRPLETMGQPLGRPLGPDGFAEDDAHWVSPQGLATRLQWSLAAPSALLDELPDPRAFVRTLLGEQAPRDVVFAAGAAENRREGLAMVLMSPAFQRV